MFMNFRMPGVRCWKGRWDGGLIDAGGRVGGGGWLGWVHSDVPLLASSDPLFKCEAVKLGVQGLIILGGVIFSKVSRSNNANKPKVG